MPQREIVEIDSFNPDDPSTYPVPDRHCGVIVEDAHGTIHEFSGKFCKDRCDWLAVEESIPDVGMLRVWVIDSVRQLEPVAIKKSGLSVEIEKLIGREWIRQVKWFYFPEKP